MLSMYELSLSKPEPILSLTRLTLAMNYIVRHHSKPRLKLASPNFNILALVGFDSLFILTTQPSSGSRPREQKYACEPSQALTPILDLQALRQNRNLSRVGLPFQHP